MEVLFASKRLKQVCSSEKALRREFGKEAAKRIALRLQTLVAVETLDDMRHLPGRCRELRQNRTGHLCLDLDGRRRLILRPTANPVALKSSQRIDWKAIESITVVEIAPTRA